MEKRDYSSGYTDFNYDVAEEVNEAHHLRYVKTPSGRKLYLLGSVDQDAAEISALRAAASSIGTRPTINPHRQDRHGQR